MRTNRRNFLRITGIAGTGMLVTGINSCNKDMPYADILKAVKQSHKQRFNMSGYAAPRIETVRVGMIGIGSRGMSAVHRLKLIEGVEIKALCDLRMECIDLGEKVLAEYGLPAARTYGGSEDAWKEMCLNTDLDLIYIATPWNLHTPMSVFAMENGKHVAVEVPAAVTVEECWQLVEMSERTKKHCMMLENCCYDYFELLTLNLARQGFFGEIIHGEGAYIHYYPLLSSNGSLPYGSKWRLIQEQGRPGNYYPTHGLGPICQVMNINRGDKLSYLTSMSCKDFVLGKQLSELAKTDAFYTQFDPEKQPGNINTSIIMTEKGKTMMLQQARDTPRVYSRIHMVSGTKGAAQKWPLPGRINSNDEWLTVDQMNEISEKFKPEIVKHLGDIAEKIGGHGGMDFMMDWRLIDCLRNGLPLDQDVYDAALWSSIGPLTDWSVSNHAHPIQVPDFTCGSYVNNIPVDIALSKGGNTQVRLIKKDERDKQMAI